jgi:GR25 family glycosyltransferase involved in LPS biosynthesis
MGINDYFDKIYCINLDRRPDRWEENCLPQFKELGMEVERFSACDGKTEVDLGHGDVYNAELAGTISHLKAIKKAKEEGVERLLLLEDDVVFSTNGNTNTSEMFSERIKQVPEDWDILFFGGNHVGDMSNVSPGVVKLNGSYAIHACGIKNTAFDIMITHLERNIDKVMGDKETRIKPSVAADYFLAQLHRSLGVYCFIPHLAWQKDGHSDIQNAYMDYDFLKKY